LLVNLSILKTGHPLNLEWRRSIFALVYVILSFGLGAAFLFVSENNYVPQDALYDRILNNIPNYEYLEPVANALTMTILVISIIFMIFLPRPWNVIVIRRALVVLGSLFFTRGLFIMMTTVPSPLGLKCQPQIIKDDYAIIRLFQLIAGTHSNCTDNVFSGHTSTVLTACYQIHFYTRYNVLRVFAWLVSITAIIFVLITRLHYTLDILCAVVIASLMHYLFVIAAESNEKYFIVKAIKFIDNADIRHRFNRNLRNSSGEELMGEESNGQPYLTRRNIPMEDKDDDDLEANTEGIVV